ncbi:MAG: hypothetical protein V3R25_10275 [Nitrosomonadaceae bacterium]
MKYFRERKRPESIKGFDIYDNTELLHNKYPLTGDRLTGEASAPIEAANYHALLNHMCSKVEGKKYYKCAISTKTSLFMFEIWQDANPMILIEELNEAYYTNPVYRLLSAM